MQIYFSSQLFLAIVFCTIVVMIAGCGHTPLPPVKNSQGDAGRSNYFLWEAGNLNNRKTIRFDSTRIPIGCGTPLCVAKQSYVVPLNNGGVAGIVNDTLAWVAGCALTGDTAAVNGVAMDAAGNIFGTSRGSFFSLDAHGAPRWNHSLYAGDPTTSLSAPLLMNNEMYFCNNNGRVFCVDTSGKERWGTSMSIGMMTQLAGTSAGEIVGVLTHGVFQATDSIVVLSKDGGIVSTWEIPGVRVVQGPIVAQDQITIAGTTDSADVRSGIIFRFDPHGKKLWSVNIDVLPLGLAVDDDGNVYVNGPVIGAMTVQSKMIQCDRAGSIRWFDVVEGLLPSSPAVTKKYEYSVAAFPGGRALYQFNRDGKIEETENIAGEPSPPIVDNVGRVVMTDVERAKMFVMESDVVGKIR